MNDNQFEKDDLKDKDDSDIHEKQENKENKEEENHQEQDDEKNKKILKNQIIKMKIKKIRNHLMKNKNRMINIILLIIKEMMKKEELLERL